MNINPIGANQTELTVANGGDKTTILFSYKTPVAANISGKFYKTEQKWSRTTSKHISRWLGDVAAEIKPQSFFDNLAS